MLDRLFTPLASVLAIVIFLLANALFQPAMSGWRMDFTETGQYSLSGGTHTTLQNLAEPVELTFVYTRRIGQEFPAVRAYAQSVRELLESYESAAGGRLKLTEIDPTPFSVEEDEALAAGITAVATDGTDPLYFGLIGRNAVDDELVIPFLAPEREAALEYDLTRLIARLDKPDPAVVGIITDLQNFKGDGREAGYFALREIAKAYEVVPIAEDFTAIPRDVDVLIVAHATSLTEWQTYLIDQFILRKGRALFLVDPASRTTTADSVFNTGAGRTRSDLGVLGESWGISLGENAVGDVAHAIPMETSDGTRRVRIGQPLYIGIPRGLMSADDLVTAPISRPVHLYAPGALDAEPAEGLVFTPLLQTDQNPAFFDAARASREATPQDIIAAYEARDGQLTLAGRLSGSLVSAFAAGPPGADEIDDPVEAELVRLGQSETGEHLAASLVPAEIIILADADMLDDFFYINLNTALPDGDNATFLLNALDNLAGSAALSNLRSRVPNLRPMVRVDAMRELAQDEFFDEQARLEFRLADARARLEELQAVGAAGGFFAGDLEAELTPEERAELGELRLNIVETRGRLRDIEREFRRNIDGLEGRLRFVNIWGGPLIVFLVGLLVWWRSRRVAV